MNLVQLDIQKRQKLIQAIDAYTGMGLLTAIRISQDPPKCTVREFLTENAFLIENNVFVKTDKITELVNWIESDSELPIPSCRAPKLEVNLTEEEVVEVLLGCAAAKLGIKREEIASAGIDLKDIFGKKAPLLSLAAFISIELNDKA